MSDDFCTYCAEPRNGSDCGCINKIDRLEKENAELVKRWADLGEWFDNHRYGPIRQNKQKILDKMEELQAGSK